MLKRYFPDMSRKLGKFLVVFLFCLLLGFSSNGIALAQTNEKVIYVRKEAHSPEAQQDIASLRVALEKMRKLDCNHPFSWYYQGAIHWLPTEAEEPGAMSGLAQNPLCPSYTQTMDQLREAWDNCTHDTAGISEIHFLPWHRVFLDQFEKVVRALSDNPNFALPYWGYVNLDTNDVNSPDISLTMPSTFIEPADQGNSLYESARFSELRQGKPIEISFVQKRLVDAVKGLNKPIPFSDFNRSIDNAPHGAMHVYIGSGSTREQMFNPIYNRQDYGLMTRVPSAGFDPIFWLHHGNIDRLWEQWNQSPNGERVSLEELKSVQWPYVFFEPDPSFQAGWKQVSYTPEQVLEMVYNPDYVYDSQPTPRVATSPEIMKAAEPRRRTKMKLTSQNTEDVVGDSPATVNLQLSPEKGINLELSESRSAETPTSPNGYAIEITVSYIGQPTGIYEVYLNLPQNGAASDKAKNDESYFVGDMNFFVMESDQPVTKIFRFDITEELLSQFQQDGINTKNQPLAISVIKEGGEKAENITIKNISLYSY